jgi:hypothetical protein
MFTVATPAGDGTSAKASVLADAPLKGRSVTCALRVSGSSQSVTFAVIRRTKFARGGPVRDWSANEYEEASQVGAT